MKKIYFNQLRYVIPLMILPFFAIIIAGTKGKDMPTTENTTNQAGMNTELQAPDLEKSASNFEIYKGSGVSNGYPNIPKALHCF